jgi:hypothetical protein
MSVFVIEDEIHAERLGKFMSREEAFAELRRLAELPNGIPPNAAPCESSATCGRDYHVIEFEVRAPDWKEIKRDHVLSTSAKGVMWVQDA